MSKNELRRRALESRRSLPHELVEAMSRRVGEKLLAQQEYRSAKTIASYVAREDEVQTVPVIDSALSEGKMVVVPLVDPSSDTLMFYRIRGIGELSAGRFGILEPKRSGPPVPLVETGIVLVPLAAWDERGYRIGHGKGHFDRALASRGRSLAIGLAFESQLVPRIPEEPHDARLDMVVTEERALKFVRQPN